MLSAGTPPTSMSRSTMPASAAMGCGLSQPTSTALRRMSLTMIRLVTPWRDLTRGRRGGSRPTMSPVASAGRAGRRGRLERINQLNSLRLEVTTTLLSDVAQLVDERIDAVARTYPGLGLEPVAPQQLRHWL